MESRKIDHTSDPIVQQVYKQDDNYLVKNTNPKSDLVFIFFSSNGIYYPNEENEFINKIIDCNRYEWENVSDDRVFREKTAKLIFVRDIHKQWYVEGINASFCDVDKTCEALKTLTAGYKVITVGSSAGGYAAVLFGCLLGAQKIFSVSGQFVLCDIEKEKLLWKHHEEERYEKYYDLRGLLVKCMGGGMVYIPFKV